MAYSLLCHDPSGLHPFSSTVPRLIHSFPRRSSGQISLFTHRQRLPELQAMKPSGQDGSRRSKRDLKVMCYSAGSIPLSDLDLSTFSIDEIPTWAIWVLGSLVVIVALPYYKKFLEIEDKVEKTSEVVLDSVEEVAEAVEKASADVAGSIPGNAQLKQLALTVEQIALTVDMDAKLAEDVIKKVDEALDKVDAAIEPIIQESQKQNVKNGRDDESATSFE